MYILNVKSFLLLLCCSLLSVNAEGESSSGSNSYLPSWLVGIIAVAVFLVLALMFLFIEPYLCKNMMDDGSYPDEVDKLQAGIENTYVNEIVDVEAGSEYVTTGANGATTRL